MRALITLLMLFAFAVPRPTSAVAGAAQLGSQPSATPVQADDGLPDGDLDLPEGDLDEPEPEPEPTVDSPPAKEPLPALEQVPVDTTEGKEEILPPPDERDDGAAAEGREPVAADSAAADMDVPWQSDDVANVPHRPLRETVGDEGFGGSGRISKVDEDQGFFDTPWPWIVGIGGAVVVVAGAGAAVIAYVLLNADQGTVAIVLE